MAAPIQVNFTDTQDIAADLGPKSLGGALYCVGSDPITHIHVYKSLDNGATWVAQDSLNAPAKASSSHTTEIGWDAVWHGTAVTVAYNKQGTIFYRIATFDTVTDTWGAESAQGPGENDSNDRDQTVRILRDGGTGHFFLFWTEFLTTFQTIQYSVYNGVSWAAQVQLVAAAGTVFNYISNACADDAGDFHIFYRKCLVQGNSGKPYHISLTPAGVIGSEQLIDNTATSTAFGKAAALPDALLLGAYNGSFFAGVWVGTPIAAPVWSFVLVDTLSLGAGVHDIGDLSAVSAGPRYGGRSFIFVSAGTAYLLFQTTNGPIPNKLGGGYTVNAVYFSSSSDGATWTAPQLVYDETTDPGAWYGTNDPDLSGISANLIGGALTLILNPNCEGVAFPTPFVAPLAITCGNPPDGQVGVAYDHIIPASGGSPPLTFAITAGALPDGLSIDAGTGEITGVPTLAGTFPFTVEVTDADLNTADVECSITIADMTILCGNPPNGKVNVPYGPHAFPVSGGVAPLEFAITAGALPSGLELEAADGTVAGTPQTAGLSTFTVEVTDSADNTASVECSIRVCPMNAQGN